MRRLASVALLLLFLFPSALLAQSSAGVIASARAVDWTKAGIPGFSSTGALPSDSWTQCGATISAGASAATILGAWNHSGSGYTSCGSNTYVKLAAGTFNVSSGIVLVGSNNNELRGSGASQTHLVFTGASTCTGGSSNCLVGMSSSDSTYAGQPPAHIYNWTAGYAQGATSITISSGTAIVANQTMLVLDQCNTGLSGAACTTGTNTDNGGFFVCADQYSGGLGCAQSGPDGSFARPERWQQEGILVTACSPACGSSGSTVITLQRPLHHPNWASGSTPQVYLIQPVTNVGIRDMSLDGSAPLQAVAGVGVFNCYGCWVRGVTVLRNYNMGIYSWQTWHADYSNNYFYNIGQESGGAPNYTDSAGVKLSASSDDLVANNIVQDARVSYFEEGPAEGNAWLYNFAVNQYVNSDFMFQAFLEHSAGDDYNLFEGNAANQFVDDNSHGDHLDATNFRNFYWGWESCEASPSGSGPCGTSTIKDVALMAEYTMSYSRYENWVANVMGNPTIETTYQTNNQSGYINNGSVWSIGGGDSPSPADSITTSTSYRWGNWDTANAATQWNASEVPTGIAGQPQAVPTATCTSSIACPASFYYSGRPSWYSSSTPFPAIGPDVSSGNVGICSGTRNAAGKFSGLPGTASAQCGSGNTIGTAWGGHVNAIPSLQAYLHFGGNLDGTSAALTSFDESYYASSLTGTTTTLSPSNFTPAAGTNITLTASITPSSGPTGTVTFFDGGVSIGTSTLPTLTHTVTAITAGTHVYTATYGGDSSYSSSTSSAATVAASGPSGSVVTTGVMFKGGVVIQ